MKRLLIAAALCTSVFAANADYSDYFSVESDKSTVNAGDTLFCLTPGVVNDGFYSVFYDYDQTVNVRNLSKETETFTCIYSWGTHPTKQEYLSHFEEWIPETMQYVYGYAKMCSTQGACYGHNHPDNLGEGTIKVPGETADGGFIYQLLNTPLDLVSVYKITIYANSHPEDVFECSVLYAPSAAAASEFLGYEVKVEDKDTSFKDFTVSPANESVVKEISEIEIYSESYPVSINPDMDDTVIGIYDNLGELAAEIPFSNIKIVDDADASDNPNNINKAVLTFTEPITSVGTYRIRIPEGLLTFGTAPEKYDMPTTILVYQVKDITDLSDVDITPAAGPVENLSGFTINVKSLMPTWNTDSHFNKLHGTLTLPGGDIVDILPDDFSEVLADPDDFWSDIIGQSYDFGTVYTQSGNYVLNIPKGMFFDSDNDIENPEWTIIWTIGTSGISGIFNDSESINVYDVNGRPMFKSGNADQLNQLPTGVYVINGKKVLIKK